MNDNLLTGSERELTTEELAGVDRAFGDFVWMFHDGTMGQGSDMPWGIIGIEAVSYIGE
jgi:hypothetical protein